MRHSEVVFFCIPYARRQLDTDFGSKCKSHDVMAGKY